MERGGRPAERLSDAEARRKEQILTQPEPAKVRETNQAVVLKQGSLFILSNDSGDVPWDLPHGYGMFYEDCRFLDGYRLTLNDEALTVLSSSDQRGYENRHELANYELPPLEGESPIPKNSVTVRRERLIRGRVFHERISLHNYSRQSVLLKLVLSFRSQFQDLFILKGFVDGPRGEAQEPRVESSGCVQLRYRGTDDFERTTTLVFDPPPEQLEASQATFMRRLAPGEQQEIAVSITPSEHRVDALPRNPARPRWNEALDHWPACAVRFWLASSAHVRTSNPLFDRVLERSLEDLRLLRSRLDGLHYFAAGVPWFVTLFGRDAATVAIQTLPYGPRMAAETLRLLAHLQARELDAYRDAEPGKILHEFRTGELAQVGEIPQSLAYYGTIDATLLFLILLAEYVNWTADLALARALRPNVEAALEWIDRYADHDGDGYLDYVGKHPNGLINQGWKDSGNAILNADGSLAEPPIALCEVQSYAYRAWRQTAELLRCLGDPDRAAELDRRAAELRGRFEHDFWSDDLGCYLLARQQGGRPVAVVSSNAGQVLWGGIASPARAARVVERLLRSDMYSGWGVRTLSSQASTYNPVSYHLGSVWPHDNGLILTGFRRYGHDREALMLFDGLFDAASIVDRYRLPELFCGFERREGEAQPVRYPVACSPQAWAAGAIPHALWALLGLRADAPNGRLRIVGPRLPAWLDWLTLENLQVGDARLDLRFQRTGVDGSVEVRPEVRAGELRVECEERPGVADFWCLPSERPEGSAT